jgi:hypothetical protein
VSKNTKPGKGMIIGHVDNGKTVMAATLTMKKALEASGIKIEFPELSETESLIKKLSEEDFLQPIDKNNYVTLSSEEVDEHRKQLKKLLNTPKKRKQKKLQKSPQ